MLGHTRPRAVLVMADFAFAQQFGPRELDRLRAVAEIDDPTPIRDLSTPEARARLADADVLVTSWGCPQLDADVLTAAPNLRAVFHCAGSVRRLVSDALWERRILVTNAVEENAEPVAEFVLAAIIFAGKRAPFLAHDARTHRDDWSYKRGRGELGNAGRTIGLVGFSRIGRRVAERLRALDVTTLVYDPVVTSEEVAAAGARQVPLDELLAASDVVSIHAPELPSTHHMIAAPQLALMRDGTTLINTARGSLVDTTALEAECAAGRLYAMLDVTDPEPLPAGSVLYDLPNVMITPHIAGSIGGETRRMSGRALTELERFAAGLPPEEAVTAEALVLSA